MIARARRDWFIRNEGLISILERFWEKRKVNYIGRAIHGHVNRII